MTALMNLSSYFAPFLLEMARIKRNSGFILKGMDAHIKGFDTFCKENYPDKHQLDRELVEAWIYNTNSKSRRMLIDRIQTMRHLANHLTAIGMQAYYCSTRIKLPKPSEPHIFTDEQLTEFFRVCDSFSQLSFPRYRHILAPTMFRVIYCCGLRNAEACNLKRENVNLSNGSIRIFQSKGHKDRIVYLAPDLLQLCEKYDAVMEMLLPERKYFFPSQWRKYFTSDTCGQFFDQILSKTSFYGNTSKKPTCHSLRHTFAVNSMRQCIANGDNFDRYIYYLCKYMGHKNPQETMYYLHMTVNLMPELRKNSKELEEVIGGVPHVEE